MVKLSYLDREFDVIYIFLMQKLLLFLNKNEKKKSKY